MKAQEIGDCRPPLLPSIPGWPPCDFNHIQSIVRDMIENHPKILAEYIQGQIATTFPTDKHAEFIGLAILLGIQPECDGAGFVIRKTRRKTGWRMLFFIK